MPAMRDIMKESQTFQEVKMKRLLIALLIVCSLLIFTACNTLEGLKQDLGFSDNSVTDTNGGNDAND